MCSSLADDLDASLLDVPTACPNYGERELHTDMLKKGQFEPMGRIGCRGRVVRVSDVLLNLDGGCMARFTSTTRPHSLQQIRVGVSHHELPSVRILTF